MFDSPASDSTILHTYIRAHVEQSLYRYATSTFIDTSTFLNRRESEGARGAVADELEADLVPTNIYNFITRFWNEEDLTDQIELIAPYEAQVARVRREINTMVEH